MTKPTALGIALQTPAIGKKNWTTTLYLTQTRSPTAGTRVSLDKCTNKNQACKTQPALIKPQIWMKRFNLVHVTTLTNTHSWPYLTHFPSLTRGALQTVLHLQHSTSKWWRSPIGKRFVAELACRNLSYRQTPFSREMFSSWLMVLMVLQMLLTRFRNFVHFFLRLQAMISVTAIFSLSSSSLSWTFLSIFLYKAYLEAAY